MTQPRSQQSAPTSGTPEEADFEYAVDLEQADAYGRSFADVYDSWYQDVTDADATARFVFERCSDHPIIELGVGSGRLALPLAGHGAHVIGLDASAPMLDHAVDSAESLTNHRGATARLDLVRADMRALPFRGPVGGVLIAFNTLFNLSTEAEQRSLLRQVRSLLSADGVLVIEALDLSSLLDGPTASIGVRNATESGLIVTATQLDGAAQTLCGQHLEIDERGVSIRPWRLRWLTPAQLDTIAAEAGLGLAERYGGWGQEPFTPESETHISVYRPLSPSFITA